MKKKITESQLRNYISQVITESLNELSPEYLKNKGLNLGDKARHSLKGKFNKEWLRNKEEQGYRIYNQGEDMLRQKEDMLRQREQDKEIEKEKYAQEIFSRLQDGVYVTAFFNEISEIRDVAIHTKKDAAYEVANTKYNGDELYEYAQVKGPFNTYEEANMWIKNNNLERVHLRCLDSEEFIKAAKDERERQKNTLMMGDKFDIEQR